MLIRKATRLFVADAIVGRFRIAVALGLLFVVSQASAFDLAQIYTMALESDPQLRAAKSSRNSTAESRPQAIADMLPELSVSATAYDNYKRTYTSPKTTAYYESTGLAVSLSQPLLHFEHWMELGKAKYSTAKADADYRAAELNLIIRVATAYFNILSAKDTVTFAKAEREAISRQLDQAKQRFEVGLIAVTDVHEAQAAYDQSRADEITARNNLDSAWEAMSEIVNELPDHHISGLRKSLPLSRPFPAKIDVWTQTALEHNYGIIAAQNNAQAARKNIGVMRSGHAPQLDLVASSGYNTTTYSSSNDYDTEAIGLELSIPLFAGGKVLSQTRQAQYDFQTATENLEQERRSVRRQVRDAYRGIVSSISRVEALKASTISAKSALAATQAGFEVGTRTIVDVLDAQRNLYRARKDYARARYDYIINGLSLKEAAGSLESKDLQMVNALLTR